MKMRYNTKPCKLISVGQQIFGQVTKNISNMQPGMTQPRNCEFEMVRQMARFKVTV